MKKMKMQTSKVIVKKRSRKKSIKEGKKTAHEKKDIKSNCSL